MQEGEPQPKLRPAREDDKFIVSRDVVVVLPEFEHDNEVFGPLECRMLWSVKAKEVHVELTEANLRYVFAALQHSPPAEKKIEKKSKGEGCVAASPKRKRRKLKKRPSQASQDDPEQPFEPVAASLVADS